MEIHNPASQELKLKFFHLPNVANSGLPNKKGEDGEGGDSLREIADLESYKVALFTAREAMASALPWNRSISAVMGLMVNTNYSTWQKIWVAIRSGLLFLQSLRTTSLGGMLYSGRTAKLS